VPGFAVRDCILLSSDKRTKQEKQPRGAPRDPLHGTAAAVRFESRWKQFGETPENSLPHGAQTIRALVFSERQAKQRLPLAKNPLTSHTVSSVLCCLGLPSAFTITRAGRENCVAVK